MQDNNQPINPPSPTNEVTATPEQPADRHDPASIYPTPTKGFGMGGYQTSAPVPVPGSVPAAVPEDKKTKLIILGVKVLGGLIVATALLSLVDWLLLSRRLGANVLSVGTIVSVALATLLGVGIYRQRELARIIYVVLGVIGLMFSAYGTFHYFTTVSKLKQSHDIVAARTEQQIADLRSNPSIPAAQKQTFINSLQNSEKLSRQAISRSNARSLYVVVGYVVSIAPLVFLTRPSVKAVFS